MKQAKRINKVIGTYLPMFLVMLVLPFVDPAISPLEAALAVHAVALPLAFVFPAVCPLVDPKSVDVIVVEFALIYTALEIQTNTNRHTGTAGVLYVDKYV